VNPRGTFVLATVAGFADTATFVKLSGLFSAHVTGNFMLLALGLERGWGRSDAVKVIAFGVFAVGAIATTVGYDTLLVRRTAGSQKAWLLNIEAALLAGAAVLSMTGRPLLLSAGGLVVVLAMSIQNVFHRVVPEAPMPSTVMTLNFTQSMIDLVRRSLSPRIRPSSGAAAPRRPFFTPSWYAIGGFTVGCAFGAVAVHYLGLAGLLFPSLALAGCALWMGAEKPEPT
jgi:uncharacterized membrane protein YoaK (UPF0700 family)